MDVLEQQDEAPIVTRAPIADVSGDEATEANGGIDDARATDAPDISVAGIARHVRAIPAREYTSERPCALFSDDLRAELTTLTGSDAWVENYTNAGELLDDPDSGEPSGYGYGCWIVNTSEDGLGGIQLSIDAWDNPGAALRLAARNEGTQLSVADHRGGELATAELADDGYRICFAWWYSSDVTAALYLAMDESADPAVCAAAEPLLTRHLQSFLDDIMFAP